MIKSLSNIAYNSDDGWWMVHTTVFPFCARPLSTCTGKQWLVLAVDEEKDRARITKKNNTHWNRTHEFCAKWLSDRSVFLYACLRLHQRMVSGPCFAGMLLFSQTSNGSKLQKAEVLLQIKNFNYGSIDKKVERLVMFNCFSAGVSHGTSFVKYCLSWFFTS